MKLQERSSQNFKTVAALALIGGEGGCPSMAAYKLPLAAHLPGCLLAVLRASIANTRTSVALQSFQIADRDREKRTGVGKSPIDGEGKERGRQLWRGV